MARLGWLAAAEPVALGGATLTDSHESIVAEELAARGIEGVMNPATASLRRVIHDYGSPDQAERFIPALSGGDIPLWVLRADSLHDLDPANLTIAASRDGDDYILEGYGDFVGQGERPGLIWAWAALQASGSDAPLAVLVPGDVEGVLIAGPIERIGHPVRRVDFRQVRVPIYSALGADGTGWDIALCALDSRTQSGTLTSIAQLDNLISYAVDTDRDGAPLLLEPVRQLILMEAFIESRLAQLMHRRNAWMRSAGQEMTYHAAQADLMERPRPGRCQNRRGPGRRAIRIAGFTTTPRASSLAGASQRGRPALIWRLAPPAHGHKPGPGEASGDISPSPLTGEGWGEGGHPRFGLSQWKAAPAATVSRFWPPPERPENGLGSPHPNILPQK